MLYRPPLPEGAIAPPDPQGDPQDGPHGARVCRTGRRALLFSLSVFIAMGVSASSLWSLRNRRCGASHGCYVSSRAQAQRTAERARLAAERRALQERLDAYEAAITRGEACRTGSLRLRIELLGLDEQLTDCPRHRAMLRAQRAHLEAQRSRLLTGHETTDQPAAQ